MSQRVLIVGDTMWFKDGDGEVRFKDLGIGDLSEWLDATETDDIVGRTVIARTPIRVPGAFGDEPATMLVLDDGSTALFVHPAEDD